MSTQLPSGKIVRLIPIYIIEITIACFLRYEASDIDGNSNLTLLFSLIS